MSNLRSAKRRIVRYRPKTGLKKPSGMAALEWEEPEEIGPPRVPEPPHLEWCDHCLGGHYLPSGRCNRCRGIKTSVPYTVSAKAPVFTVKMVSTSPVRYEITSSENTLFLVGCESLQEARENLDDLHRRFPSFSINHKGCESDFLLKPVKPVTPFVHVIHKRGLFEIKSSDSLINGRMFTERADLGTFLLKVVYGKGLSNLTCEGFDRFTEPSGFVNKPTGTPINDGVTATEQNARNTIPEPEPNTIHPSILRQIKLGMVVCEVCHETIQKGEEIATIENDSIVHSCCKDLKEVFLDKE